MDVEENASKSLYICTVEGNKYFRHHSECRFTVQAISLPHLFTFKENIKVSASSDNSQDTLILRKIASFQDIKLPYLMGCGFRGSQVVLAGGTEPQIHKFHPSSDIYVCDITSSSPEFKREVIPKLCGPKNNPLVVEIKDKLYILAGGNMAYNERPTFEVFDSESNVWTKLPEIPFFQYPRFLENNYRYRLFAYVVVGTKILMCYVVEESPVFLFDVAEPDRGWWLLDELDTLPFWGKALVLDVEGCEDRKILFAVDAFRYMGAYLMKLKGGVPIEIERLVERYVMPKFVANSYNSYTFSDLGGGNVCFVACTDIQDPDIQDPEEICVKLVISTFQFSYSIPEIKQTYSRTENPAKRMAVEARPSTDDSTDDSDSFISDDNGFHMTVVGELTFDYHWAIPVGEEQFYRGSVGLASSVF